MAKIKKNVTKNEMMYRIQRKIMFCIREATELRQEYDSSLEAGQSGEISFKMACDYQDKAEILSTLFLDEKEIRSDILTNILTAIEREISSRV